MKIQIAKLNYLRIAPRKVRLVANLIKGMPVNQAQAQLMFNPRKAALPILKLLQSAIASAKTKNLNEKKLVVKEIKVDQGPAFKRYMPRAMGRATLILKKTSHITLILEEAEKEFKEKFKIEKKEKKSKKEKEPKKEKQKPPIKITSSEKEGKEQIKKEAPEKDSLIRKIFRRKTG